ncbi:MAG: DNA-directed RNA polymerase subunit alpha C-terminal domain-containing protein [Candidatus Magasanikbacteria bacterium]
MFYSINLVWNWSNCFYEKEPHLRFIGDLVGSTERNRHVQWIVQELLGFPIWTEFDEETKRAFKEARQLVRMPRIIGYRDSDWPEWYVQSYGRDLPAVDGEIHYCYWISKRVENCLLKANIRYVGDLARKTQEELMALKGFGKESLKKVMQDLTEKGLKLGMPLPGWIPPNKRG